MSMDDSQTKRPTNESSKDNTAIEYASTGAQREIQILALRIAKLLGKFEKGKKIK